MPDQSRASAAAGRGIDEWCEGKLVEAEISFREAIRHAEPHHDGLSHYYQSLAGVLAGLGRTQEADAAFEEGLQFALQQQGTDASSPVAMARYFLGEHLLTTGRPEQALEIIRPSFGGTKLEGLLRFIEARAWRKLGDHGHAKTAAEMALKGAASPKQRQNIEEALAELHE